jgi:hypothetical protein
MSLDLHVLQTSEIDEILSLEGKLLAAKIPDEMERLIFSWNCRWRKESLEHYIPLGWSFCARKENQLTGYFIAQALLFFDGQTQSMWVEHMQFTDTESRTALIELAVKLGREKHLQKVYFPNEQELVDGLKNFKSEPWSSSILQVRTTKT